MPVTLLKRDPQSLAVTFEMDAATANRLVATEKNGRNAKRFESAAEKAIAKYLDPPQRRSKPLTRKQRLLYSLVGFVVSTVFLAGFFQLIQSTIWLIGLLL